MDSIFYLLTEELNLEQLAENHGLYLCAMPSPQENKYQWLQSLRIKEFETELNFESSANIAEWVG